MTKKILVVGEYYSENLGDGVICETVKTIIQDLIPDANITIADIMGRKNFITDEAEAETIAIKDNKNWREALKNNLSNLNGKGLGYFYDRMVYNKWLETRKEDIKVIKENCSNHYDLVVFAGGQLMYEPFAIPIGAHIEEFEKKNTPVIFNGCGFGKFTNHYAITQFSSFLNAEIVQDITVRDYVSEVNDLLLASNRIKATKTNDPALWVSEAYGITKTTSDVIGLGIIRRSDPVFNTKQKELYKQIITTLNKSNTKWQLFCNGEVADQNFALELLQEMGLSPDHVAPRPLIPEQLVKLIASYQAIISFRLHSHIIATSLGIPGIGMTWDKKVNFFFSSFGCEDRCFSVNSSAAEILSKLDTIKNIPFSSTELVSQKKFIKTKLNTSIQRIFHS